MSVKPFTLKENMTKHMLTHSERKFQCDRCDKKFTSEIKMKSKSENTYVDSH